MSEDEKKNFFLDDENPRWAKHRLLLMVVGVVFIVIVVTFINLEIYRQNGAELDASRLSVSERKKISDDVQQNSAKAQTFSASGEINQSTLDEFSDKFTKERQNVRDINAFGGSVLDDASLGFKEDAVEPVQQ